MPQNRRDMVWCFDLALFRGPGNIHRELHCFLLVHRLFWSIFIVSFNGDIYCTMASASNWMNRIASLGTRSSVSIDLFALCMRLAPSRSDRFPAGLARVWPIRSVCLKGAGLIRSLYRGALKGRGAVEEFPKQWRGLLLMCHTLRCWLVAGLSNCVQFGPVNNGPWKSNIY